MVTFYTVGRVRRGSGGDVRRAVRHGGGPAGTAVPGTADPAARGGRGADPPTADAPLARQKTGGLHSVGRLICNGRHVGRPAWAASAIYCSPQLTTCYVNSIKLKRFT